MGTDQLETIYITDRQEWRTWLEDHFKSKPEIWLVYPKKSAGKERILYNDAVEEALCFGWIDSTVKSLDPHHTIQRFTPRKAKSSFSQANRERLKWLEAQNMIHPSVLPAVKDVLKEAFEFPKDIISEIRKEPVAWENYQKLSDPYKRIRVAYIVAARKRPEEFQKRLLNFIEKTKENKLIRGFGGIEKYY
ncbi:hypothetical protein GWK08_17950 [Leptobacterium flavescens]|uniref:Bacteriocin-protection protein n=1 Tax=Leptobacterium flavescens TaxID=472055 RepID=A0A6P0UXD4_9FLAO|nr:YdeI/OmpD-associated family protein [Leptobacterium flavescens]NER15343.1 hypothetical protein [Leptobacterium flavescens]